MGDDVQLVLDSGSKKSSLIPMIDSTFETSR